MKGTKDISLNPVLPDELSYLITSFIPSQTSDHRSKAYLTLSAFCQGVRSSSPVKGKQPDPATEALVRVFSPLVLSYLQETEEPSLLAGLSFLTALFQVDPESASSIFQQDGVLELVMDCIELNPSLELSLHVAHLLSQACGHKSCRQIIPSETLRWLEAKSHQTGDAPLRAAAAIALIKFARGSRADNSEVTGSDVPTTQTKDDELASMMKQMVVGPSDQSSIGDAVEGLAYLTVDPGVKELLSNDPVFIKHLCSLIPPRKSTSAKETNSTLLYGILVIICNICSYRPQLSEEQTQIEKLRRMAKAGNDTSSGPDAPSSLDSDEKVKFRARKLVAGGVSNIFAAAIPAMDSAGVRLSVGKALLGIVTDKDNRGSVLQSGGAKILMLVIKHGLPIISPGKPSKLEQLDVAYLEPIQALAKLAITSSPVQVFGPNVGAVYDAIRPLSMMLQHPSSTLLQRFEALMALTNLASYNAESASRVAVADGLMNKVEFLLLEEHPLVRRASMELICNLIAGSETVFERYGGTESNASAKSKLQVVLALSDVEDLATRLAASGALATVTASPSACQSLLALQFERHRVFPILAQLIDPTVTADAAEMADADSNPGLVHRGVICSRNILLSISEEGVRKQASKEAQDGGLVTAMVNLIKSGQAPEEIMRPTAEALKVLMDQK